MKYIISLIIFIFFILVSLILKKNKKYYNKFSILLISTAIIFSSAIKWGLIYFEINNYLIIINSFSLLLILLIILLYKKNKISFFKSEFKFIFICLLIIILIILFQAILLKIYNTTNYISILTVYINLLLLLLFSYTLSKYNYNIKEIIIPIVIFSFINSILGLIQFKTGKLFINFKDQEALIRSYSTVKRVSGFIIGDNGAGNLGAILFPILLYNYNNKKNLINLLVLVLNILFTILTFTRIGYLAIIIEIMIYFLYKNKFNNIKNIILFITKIIIIYFCIICFYKFAYNKFYQILFIDRGDTVTGRFLQFRYALMAFITKPLSGIGTGQYNEYIVNNLFLFDPCVIHSQLLNTLVEGGLLIFIPFILFNIFIILKLIKKYKMKNEFIYIIMLIIGNLIATNFNPNQYYDINIYIYYTILFLFLFENKVDFKNKTKDSFYN